MKRAAVWLSLVLLFSTQSAAAQDGCALTETIDACFTRLVQAVHPSEAQVAAAERAEAVTEAQPGAESSGGQVQSTITDLIPLLSALGLLSESDTSDGAVTLDLNFLLPVAEAERNSQLTALINLKPVPYEPLILAFPEAVRAEREAQLEDQIEDTGDAKVQFTWSLVTERFGRDFRRQSPVIDALLTPLVSESRALFGPENRAARLKYMQTLQTELIDTGLVDQLPDPDNFGANTFAQIEAVSPELKSRVSAAVALAAASAGEHQKAVSEHLNKRLALTGTDQLAKLVLQQPQLLFAASREFRDELVGPEAWSVKVTYEHSFANLGHFMRKRGRSDCALDRLRLADAVAADRCYAALRDYLDDYQDELVHEDRWALSAEYRKFDAVNYDFAADGVSLAVPKRDRLIVGLGYGRGLSGSRASDRVDFQLDYDSAIDDEPDGQSRFVVSFTYTRKVGELNIPFGIVYANKSEFIEGVDKLVSLHVGVKFSPPE